MTRSDGRAGLAMAGGASISTLGEAVASGTGGVNGRTRVCVGGGDGGANVGGLLIAAVNGLIGRFSDDGAGSASTTADGASITGAAGASATGSEAIDVGGSGKSVAWVTGCVTSFFGATGTGRVKTGASGSSDVVDK